MSSRGRNSATHSLLYALIFTSLSLFGDALAQPAPKLLALVIGNKDYHSENSLPGVDNDVNDVRAVFQRLGFQIVNIKPLNLTKTQMLSAFEAFLSSVDSNTVAVLYYSGHGLEEAGENYLVPVDANPKGPEDVPKQMVRLNQLLSDLARKSAFARIVILDACRNMPAMLAQKSIGRTPGLASVQVSSGTRLVYAAAPGQRAAPARFGERNSVFTAGLLAALSEGHGTFDVVLRRAAELTENKTNKLQSPWSTGNIAMSFRLRNDPSAPYIPTPSSATLQQGFEQRYQAYENLNVQANTSQALLALKKLAEEGYAPAQYDLGKRYLRGEPSLEQSYRAAFDLFSLAARAGHAASQHNLAVMYQDGVGVARNETQALLWYAEAARAGYEPSRQVLQRVGRTW